MKHIVKFTLLALAQAQFHIGVPNSAASEVDEANTDEPSEDSIYDRWSDGFSDFKKASNDRFTESVQSAQNRLTSAKKTAVMSGELFKDSSKAIAKNTKTQFKDAETKALQNLQSMMGREEEQTMPAAKVVEMQQKSAPDSICIPYSENRYQRFHRLGLFFKEGSPVYCINPVSQVGMTDGLKMFKYGMQGEYGDQDKTGRERPGVWQPVERAKFDAWASVKGMKRETAQIKLMQIAEVILEREGVNFEDPAKPKLQAKYTKCVKKALASGMTQQEINMERVAYIKRQIHSSKDREGNDAPPPQESDNTIIYIFFFGAFLCISCRYALCRTTKSQIVFEEDCKSDLVRSEDRAPSVSSSQNAYDHFQDAKQIQK